MRCVPTTYDTMILFSSLKARSPSFTKFKPKVLLNQLPYSLQTL